MRLDSGWRVVGQPVEFDLHVMLMSDGPPQQDARRVARQLARAIPGAMISYPTGYEHKEASSAGEWSAVASGLDAELLAALWAEEPGLALERPRAPSAVLNIGKLGLGSKMFLDAVCESVTPSAVGVVGDHSSERIGLYMPDRYLPNTTIVQRAVDTDDPAACAQFAAAARATHRYVSGMDAPPGPPVPKQIRSDPDRTQRVSFLKTVADQADLLGYRLCYQGSEMLGARIGILPVSDHIILEIPDIGPGSDGVAWSDDGPLWLRKPAVSGGPLGVDDEAVRGAATQQAGYFQRALRMGGHTRGCVAGVDAGTPERAELLAELVAGYAKDDRPSFLPDPRFTVVARGRFGGQAGARAAALLSSRFPETRVDLVVSVGCEPVAIADLAGRRLGSGLRVVAARPPKSMADYGRFGEWVDALPTQWAPPKRKLTPRDRVTEVKSRIAKHLRS